MNTAVNQRVIKRLIIFGHNRKDVALIRRLRSFRNTGLKVTGFTFRRDGEKAESHIEWSNVDLGYVEHAKLGKRVLVLIKSLTRILRHRSTIKEADVLYARNLDIYLLAWFARVLVPFASPVLVYECLDVHETLTGSSLRARFLRWVERRILNHCDLLVVSSPGFLENYFKPIQNYIGNCFLIENKIHIDTDKIKRPLGSNITEIEKRPIRLVWAGILRCQKTLDIMKALAVEMGDDIEISFWGKLSNFLIPDFEEQIKDIRNIKYHGVYVWPQGLSKVYEDIDLSWSHELSWAGFNSDWLIPNRIYEGSYYGSLSLAIEGTQTAKCVSDWDVGYVIPDSEPNIVIAFIKKLDKSQLYKKRISLLNIKDNKFVYSDDDTRNLVEAMRKCREASIKCCG